MPTSIAWNGPHNATVLAVAKVAAGLPLIDISGTLFRAVWLTAAPQVCISRSTRPLPAELRVLQFIRGIPTKAKAANPFATFSVTADVHRILDLMDASITSALGLTKALLRVKWEAKMKTYLAGKGAMHEPRGLSRPP